MSKVDHYRVNQGGLMRCCTASLDDEMSQDDSAEKCVEGAVIRCHFCDSSMRYSNGVWAWAKDLYPSQADL